jgi:MFS family permease
MWGGLLISVAGSQMQNAALLWHLRTLSTQPVVVSGIGLVRFFPILIFSAFAGVVADSFNRRTIMFLTQTTLTITAGMLALLTWMGVIQIWHIYLLSAIQAVAIAFDLPARQALIPNLVPREALPSAFGLNSIAFNTGAIAGPALSGIVIGYLGQQYTYLINAVSFLALLGALVMMGPIAQETRPATRGMRETLTSINEGVHFIITHPIILSSMLLDFVATFFSSAGTLLPFLARDILKVNEVAFGWLVAAESVGAVMIGLFFSQRSGIRRQGRLLLAAVAAFGLATMLLGTSKTFLMAMIALILVGAGDSISTILRNTIRQLQTPDYIRGRMVSINQIFFQGGPQLGEIEAGLAAQAFGIPFAIISGGVGCVIAVTLVAVRWPQLRRYNGEEATPA